MGRLPVKHLRYFFTLSRPSPIGEGLFIAWHDLVVKSFLRGIFRVILVSKLTLGYSFFGGGEEDCVH